MKLNGLIWSDTAPVDGPGLCGDFLQANGPVCGLRHGHAGMHSNGFTHWVTQPPEAPSSALTAYFDFRDWWVGYYRGPSHHYVCLVPTVVIRWGR